MKKFFIVFSGFLTALLLTVAVSAIETHTVSPCRDTIRNYDGVFVTLYEAMVSGAESADLSPYKIDTKDIGQVYSDVILASPELFYMDNTVTYFYNSREQVTSVEFNYRMEPEERGAALQMYEREVDYIVSLVDPAMSEAEKALFVHDYLLASYSYDTDVANFDALSLFRERSGVCQAYSLAYMAVLRELGMDAVMVTSDEMNHAWNLVEVDGTWYHVDLSFDDPSPDRMGRVLHENFLLDDEGIRNTPTPHYGWKSSVRCLSASFKKAIWHGVTSRMIRLNGQWYYIDPGTMSLAVSAFDGSGRADVYRFRNRWMTSFADSSYYVGVFSGLSECLGYLFINTPYDIIIYSPGTGHANVYLEYTDEQKIFGSTIYKYTLEYFIADSPEGERGYTKTFEITGFEEEDFGKELPFDDVLRLDTYYASVKFVYDRGLFRGVSETKFAPDAYLTRAMFVTVLGRLCGVDESLYADRSFVDVERGQWYSPYVEWAADTGIVNGVGDNRFDPLGELTHEQMYKIVAMCGDYLDAGTPDISGALILYEDRAKISDWAFESVAYCKVNDLIGENFAHKIYPASKATRAEAADIISRFAILCGKV
ncbi:MAG: S-layer homology domain-containing protein [Clostridia bacterium]|nr:S-layer homology domain-containing protein [Clostridia bacterium]